jgi:hypothetical protein
MAEDTDKKIPRDYAGYGSQHTTHADLIAKLEQDILILGGEIKIQRMQTPDRAEQSKLFDEAEVPLGNMLEELQKVKATLGVKTNLH